MSTKPAEIAARLTAGLCTQCGKRESVEGLRSCQYCRDAHAAYYRRHRNTLANPEAERVDALLRDLRSRCGVDGQTPAMDDPVCLALIEAHGGPMELEHIGEVLLRGSSGRDRGVSKERVRQLVERGLAKVAKAAPELAVFLAGRDRRTHWDMIAEEETAW